MRPRYGFHSINYMEQYRFLVTWPTSEEITWSFGRPVHPVLCDEELEDVCIYLQHKYTPGGPDTYDASRGGPGGWDPGDGPEADLYGAVDEDNCAVALTDEQYQQALDFIYAKAPEPRGYYDYEDA